ncbi:MAG: hypothetical protein AAF806_12460 [Bacteroidota bacterium]
MKQLLHLLPFLLLPLLAHAQLAENDPCQRKRDSLLMRLGEKMHQLEASLTWGNRMDCHLLSINLKYREQLIKESPCVAVRINRAVDSVAYYPKLMLTPYHDDGFWQFYLDLILSEKQKH